MAQRRGRVRGIGVDHRADQVAPVRRIADVPPRAIGDLAAFYRGSYTRIYGVDGAPMHDACAIIPFVRPSLIRHEPAALEVSLAAGPARGMTVVDRRGVVPGVDLPPARQPKPANVAMAVEVDRRAVIDELVATLLAYDRTPPA